MNAFKDWFLQSSPREQIFLGLGGIVVFLTLLYMLMLHPLISDRNSQVRTNKAALEQQLEVRRLASELLAQQQSGSRPGQANLSNLLNSTMRKYGLSFEDFQPSGTNEVRVRLAKAELNKIFAWLDEIENREGVQIKDISVVKGPEPGTALVNLKLQRG